MKKSFLLFLASWFTLHVFSQNVGIGTTSPDPSAKLDITSTNSGMLVPRMTISQRNAISTPANGLLIYQTDNTAGFYYYDGSAWKSIAGVASTGWLLNGNAGTNPASDFIGTTDNQPLRFRINNEPAGQLQPGTGNIFWGIHAGKNNTTGYSNVAIGRGALSSNASASQNIAIGDSTLYNSIQGSNIAIGSMALYSNSLGLSNIAIGLSAMQFNGIGKRNVGVGHLSLNFNISGDNNTAVGTSSLRSNTSGHYNTALGNAALYENTMGHSNVAVGSSSLQSNSVGYRNTATGFSSLSANTTGVQNTASGSFALYANTVGNNNSAVGYTSLSVNSTGYDNSAFGVQSLYSNTIGHENVALGIYALVKNSTGNLNVASGKGSLFENTSGHYNTAVGALALYNNTTSQFNTAIGYAAGGNATFGYNNTFVGASTRGGLAGNYNMIVIGNEAVSSASNQVTIGNPSNNSYRVYANWSNISDGRYKKNVHENVPGLSFITQLRPVTYNIDATGLDAFIHQNHKDSVSLAAKGFQKTGLSEKEKITYTGFVAQEVETLAKSLGFDFSGIDLPKNDHDTYGLRYADFVVPLVKAVQEQQDEIETLRKDNKMQSGQIDELIKRIEILEKKNN